MTEVPTTHVATGAGRHDHPVYLSTNDRLGRVLSHPALNGFARLTLPWDDRNVDAVTFWEIGSLLPYHTHVDSDVVVSGLNRLIGDAVAGKTVFYDIYTTDQERAEPTRKNTGLFFFRGEPDAPFALIAPGGGFAYVASLHEGFPYAVEINTRGFNAFVLKYRAGEGGAVATHDMAAAIAFIVRHASELQVGTAAYSLWGSSAGARMAAAIGTHGTAPFGAPALPKPAAIVIAYTGHANVGSEEPPTFAVVGERDGIAPPRAMERRIARLRQAGTDVDLRTYPGLGHGFGLGVGTSAEGWIADAMRFWARHIRRSRE